MTAHTKAMMSAFQSAKTFEDMPERSEELTRASRRAGDLANKLLALERASARGNTGVSTPVALVPLPEEVCTLKDLACMSCNVTLTLSLPDARPIVTGDTTMISEAVTNLIDNALPHSGTALSETKVTLSMGPPFVTITVADNGCGIPPEMADKAKERFRQVGPSEGSGLGLAIADAVSKHHGGRRDIAPRPDGLDIMLFLKRDH